MSGILELLRGNDRRSIGKADEVVRMVIKKPGLFGELFSGILSDDPVLRMRAADAAEKVSAKDPALLVPHKKELLEKVVKIDQQEVRWHVAQMLPRADLSQKEIRTLVPVLESWIENDKSNIVKVFAMQALFDFSQEVETLKPQVKSVVQRAVSHGSAAVRNRGKKLLQKL